MSNALSLLLAQTDAAPAPTPGDEKAAAAILLPLLGLGVVVLLVWIVRRAANPQKLSLQDTPGRPNSIGVMHIVLLLLAYIGASLAFSSFFARWFETKSHRHLIATSIPAQIVVLAATIWLAKATFQFGLKRGLGLSMRHWLYDSGRGIVGYLGSLPLVMVLVALTSWLLPKDVIKQHDLLKALAQLPAHWKALGAFSAVILAPLWEEVFFRGILQSMVRRHTGQPWAAIAVASVIFAAMHYTTPQNIPGLLLLGVVLGYNYERCGRLWPAIVIHMVFNGVFVAIQMIAYR